MEDSISWQLHNLQRQGVIPISQRRKLQISVSEPLVNVTLLVLMER